MSSVIYASQSGNGDKEKQDFEMSKASTEEIHP